MEGTSETIENMKDSANAKSIEMKRWTTDENRGRPMYTDVGRSVPKCTEERRRAREFGERMYGDGGVFRVRKDCNSRSIMSWR